MNHDEVTSRICDFTTNPLKLAILLFMVYDFTGRRFGIDQQQWGFTESVQIAPERSIIGNVYNKNHNVVKTLPYTSFWEW